MPQGFDNPARGFLNKRVIATAGAAVRGLLTVFNSVSFVGQTERGIDYRFGKIVTDNTADLRTPGLNFKTPFVDSIAKVRTDLQQANYTSLETYTKDNQTIHADLSVFFKIAPDKILEIARNNPDWEAKLETTAINSFKSALGDEEAQNVAQHRADIMKRVTQETAARVMGLLGIEITDVQMPNYNFDKEFVDAVAKAANAKADLNRKQTELEQAKVDAQSAVARQQGISDAQRVEADAKAYVTRQTAQADADGNLAKATAEAKGFDAIAKSIGQGNMQTYMLTKRWNGSVPTVSGGNANVLDLRTLAPAASNPAP
jgi:regulator of protease activity HflC (stomatin/prohibitin superfamily)